MNASTSSCGNEGSSVVDVMDSPPSGSHVIDFGVGMEAGLITIGQDNVVDSDYVLEPKHKVFLSHSGAQKDFVEQLCVDLQGLDRYPFFDKLRSSLPIGERFPKLIFEAIGQCQVGVLVFSEEFFMRTKWPMLELNAMVKEFEKPKTRMKIIPLFYHITLHDWKSSENQSRWISQWEEWARKDKRIDVEEWKKALRVLESINSLEMKEGMGDVKFRKEIVREICGLIPQETRWDDSHVQGRSRMCEVICKNMDEVSSKSAPCVVGVHGVGGIGKTTVCKALCNYLASKFHDHVCHVELGQGNEMKMLQKALKALTSMSHEILDKLDDMEQGYTYLKKRMQDVPVFLALDNVQDDSKSIQAARAYLRGGYGVGSVVLVTARSKDVLRKLKVEERQCLEMPELEEEDARSLFLSSSGLSLETSVDEQITRKCIQVCHLYKADGTRRHYHPLALKVLGQQIGSNLESWKAQLSKINKINELEDVEGEIFCILRSSYDSLSQTHKLIFMDLASMINSEYPTKYAMFEWLCMVHEESVANMKGMLEVLKRRSIVEILSDDFTRLGMHDLWREFAILEWKVQDSIDPRWVYQANGKRIKGSGQWRASVERMVFAKEGWKGLKGLNLADFVNVEVFKLEVDSSSQRDCSLHLDLSGLTSLKSLEVETPGMAVKTDGLSSLTNLGYLRWDRAGDSQCLGGIRHLTALQYLNLQDCKDVKALDLTELKLLRALVVSDFPNLIRVVGLSLRMISLRHLILFNCSSLRECPGLGELYGLERLVLSGCTQLRDLPWLGRLRRLRELNISFCKSIGALPGLGDLVDLEELFAVYCSKFEVLPGLAKLTKLRRLDLVGSPLQDVHGLDGLSALSRLDVTFDKLQGELPILSKLSMLISVRIEGWNGQIWAMIQNMLMLEELQLQRCNGEDVVPNLHGQMGLKVVNLLWCNFKDLSGLNSLTVLESLSIDFCKQLQRLPAFERLTSLRQLRIKGSHENITDWPRRRSLCSLHSLEIAGFPVMKIFPALESLLGLRVLSLSDADCESVLSMASSLQVAELEIKYDTMEALDLSNFPQLKGLDITGCYALRRVTCDTPLTALSRLAVYSCQSLVELPDLSTFPELEVLRLFRCSSFTRLSCSSPLDALRRVSCDIPLTALSELEVNSCQSLVELPDLSTFPELEVLRLFRCSSFTRLSCSSPLTAMRDINLSGCAQGREILPELTWFPNLTELKVDDSTSEHGKDGKSASGKCHLL